jgi:hypothetical protein
LSAQGESEVMETERGGSRDSGGVKVYLGDASH